MVVDEVYGVLGLSVKRCHGEYFYIRWVREIISRMKSRTDKYDGEIFTEEE